VNEPVGMNDHVIFILLLPFYSSHLSCMLIVSCNMEIIKILFVLVCYVLERRLAAKSIYWYVPVDRQNVAHKLHVPALDKLDPALQQEGQQAYEKLQTLRRETSNQSLLLTSSGSVLCNILTACIKVI
jgi:hypothetical protein